MSTISEQHPAVVLRSRYRNLRALLAVAMIAVVSLAAAVVVLAVDDDSSSGTATVQPVSAPAQPQTAGPDVRYDGGPEEGTRGPSAAPTSPDIRYDGGPEEGTRGPGN